MAKKINYSELENEIERLSKQIALIEERIKEAQQLAKMGDWEWDLKEKTLIWSDEVYHIFGLDPVSFRPSPESFEAANHPDDREEFLKQRKVLLNKRKKACIEHRIVLPDGSVRYVQERTRFISNHQNEIRRVIGTVQDITEFKQAEKGQEELLKKLQQELENVKTLNGLLPICAQCKKIRDNEGDWNQIEGYFQKNSHVKFTHSLCPGCVDTLYGNEDWYKETKVKDK